MLPKEQYGRASGMIALAEAVSGIVAPISAGILLNVIGIGGIMAIDVITFIVAIGALLVIHIPQPHLEDAAKAERGSIWEDSVFGFKYIYARRGLLGLLTVLVAGGRQHRDVLLHLLDHLVRRQRLRTAQTHNVTHVKVKLRTRIDRKAKALLLQTPTQLRFVPQADHHLGRISLLE